ncbi:MAG: hypothetical protein IJR55_03895 [Clostridia bacterium]|nr:hypothetical protein [Clostridia bacterium]
MTVSALKDALGLEILSLPKPDREINGAYAGDLLSWVMGRAEEDCVWATIMTNVNVIAVASLVDVACAVVCEESEIGDDVINTAAEKGVNLLRTKLPIYEFCVEISKLI